MTPNLKYQVTASIVLYNPDADIFKAIDSFLKIKSLTTFLFLIDNSPSKKFQVDNELLLADKKIKYIFNNKNVGYGAAHNIALKEIIEQSEYHLILNPDVYFNEDVVEKIYAFASLDKNIGHIMPKIFYPDGQLQYACKLIPAPLDLIARLLPGNLFKKRNKIFELQFTGYNKIMEVPYMSGCFMFLKCLCLKEIGLFDERFFMYPEDIDLTRRIQEKFKTIYYPAVDIFHAHAKSSFKSKEMFLVHTTNIIKYFNKWGWFFDKKRKSINSKILNQFKNLN